MRISRSLTSSPAFIAALAVVIATLAGGIAVYEVRQARREVLGVLEQEAYSLIESIAIAGEGAIRSYGEIEGLVAQRLLACGRLLRRFDDQGRLSDDLLARIARESGIHRISVFDGGGRGVYRSHPDGRNETLAPDDLFDLLGDQDEIVIGLWETEQDPGRRFAVALKRSGSGAIVLSVDAAHMLDFRKSIGVGRLVQDVGENAGIDYVLLQDEEGIVSASKNITTMAPIAGDPFLDAVLRGGISSSRVTKFGERETFEIIQPFLISEGRMGLLRVGLSMDAVREAEQRIARGVGAVIGLLTGAIAVFLGLIALRHSHASLRRAHARLESTTGNVLSGMADAVVAVDREGRITVFNRAAEHTFGYAAAEAVGRRYTEFVEIPSPVLEETIARGESLNDFECRYETRKGRRLILSISASPLRDDEGRIDGSVAVIHDLTERKRLEEEAHRRDRLTAMGELASGVAHEVRNPLNAIGIIAQRLKREFVPSLETENYRALLDTVRSEVERVNGIVRQFLEFARPPDLSPVETDVAVLLEEAVGIVESRAREKGLSVRRAFDGVGKAVLDPNQMKQALLNLLTNALDATETGAITVAARRGKAESESVGNMGSTGTSHTSHAGGGEGEGLTSHTSHTGGGGWAEISVADTGRGIPPENLSRIFDLYFTTRPEGTGLGLSLVHRIVAEHGGRIHVESEVGRGTTVTIALPRTQPA